MCEEKYPAHNIFKIDGVTFSSKFDNGNLLAVEKVGKKSYEYQIWSACDNHGTPKQTKHCTWFYFTVSGLPQGCAIKIHIMNPNRNSGLYRFDMRPVFRSSSTNQHWVRIRSPVRFQKGCEGGAPLTFEHVADNADGTVSFAFTYPYTYTMVQRDLDAMNTHVNDMSTPDSIYFARELLTTSPDGRRVDLVTITSVDGASDEKEPLLPDLFPDTISAKDSRRPLVFPEKEIVFISARVHPGEVPAQHTWRGIYDFLLDPHDLRAIVLRRKYVFKMVPILNPDGVYRGHFRCDQFGNNLNRHYLDPDTRMHPSIYAVKHLLDIYSHDMAMYLDLHAHASKRGCFIYGNVLDTLEHQVQNQLFCRLIAMNSAHFDYEGCLFSREHMQRIDPGDAASGLTAEGSGRVSTYMAHKLVHSYTLECNYNSSKYMNEIAATDGDPHGKVVTPASSYATTSEKYTPSVYAGVGRACLVALLDIKWQNPCSRIPKTKVKTLERVRLAVINEVKQRPEYRGQVMPSKRRTSSTRLAVSEVEPFAWTRRVDVEAAVIVSEPPAPFPNFSLSTTTTTVAGETDAASVGGNTHANSTGSNQSRSKSASNGAVLSLPKFARPRRSKSSGENSAGNDQVKNIFGQSSARNQKVCVAQQIVTADSMLDSKDGRGKRGAGAAGESNAGSKASIAIPRVPKYDRALHGSKAAQGAGRMMLAGNAITAEEQLPFCAASGLRIEERPPSSKYRLDIERIEFEADEVTEPSGRRKSSDESSNYSRAALRQRPPDGSRKGSESVRISDYSPRALRDMGLPVPPSKSNATTAVVPSKKPGSGLRKSGQDGSGGMNNKRGLPMDRISRIPRASVKT